MLQEELELELKPDQLLDIIATGTAQAIAEGRDKLIGMLESLQQEYQGFKFTFTYPNDGSKTVTSLIVQTAAMRRRLHLFGDVIFIDGTEKTNDVQLK